MLGRIHGVVPDTAGMREDPIAESRGWRGRVGHYTVFSSPWRAIRAVMPLGLSLFLSLSLSLFISCVHDRVELTRPRNRRRGVNSRA